MKGLAVWNGECPILSIYEYRGSFMMVYMVDLITIFYFNVSLFFQCFQVSAFFRNHLITNVFVLFMGHKD